MARPENPSGGVYRTEPPLTIAVPEVGVLTALSVQVAQAGSLLRTLMVTGVPIGVLAMSSAAPRTVMVTVTSSLIEPDTELATR